MSVRSFVGLVSSTISYSVPALEVSAVQCDSTIYHCLVLECSSLFIVMSSVCKNQYVVFPFDGFLLNRSNSFADVACFRLVFADSA